jgi:uncharacterized protein YcbK (DUF882 family)
MDTAHFKQREFACPHCGVALARPRLLLALELLRTEVRRPIPIESGYRCPVHNKQVGGASDSQHMYGAAADIPLGIASLAQGARAGFVGIGTQNG